MNHERLGLPNGRSTYYDRFSTGEFDRRMTATREMMRDESLDALVLYGNSGFERTNVEYLTNYRPAFLTYFVCFRDPTESSTLFVGISNHLQFVRERSVVDDIRVSLPGPAQRVADRLAAADSQFGRVGIVGVDPRYDLSIPHSHHAVLEASLRADLVDATTPFLHLLATKSEAELDRIRRAGEITDAGMTALVDAVAPRVTELELARTFQDACRAAGGERQAQFISAAPMIDAEPGACLPWKQPSSRPISNGDVVTTEVGATYRGYATQIHRPISVGRSPTPLYRDLFDVARETYDSMLDALRPGNEAADVHGAMEPVESSEFKCYDVSLHGYGNGYLHPFVGTRNSNYWPGMDDPVTATWVFEKDMVVVVQPNVVTPDETAGLQLGATVIITDQGAEVVEDYPVEFVRA